MKSFNLNNYVKVRLTEEGRQMIIDHYAKGRNANRDDIAKHMVDNNIGKDGLCKLPLHQVMEYFGGDKMVRFTGGKPFETLDIMINEKDLIDVQETTKLKKSVSKDDDGITM